MATAARNYMRRAARVDNNQKQIVSDLRQFPHISVETSHDDILVGYQGRTYWYEIKSERALKVNGEIKEGEKQQSQIRLIERWKGHYRIVTSLDEILNDIGFIK